MKGIINTIIILFLFPCLGAAQPEKGFYEVFSNHLILDNVVKHLQRQDISSLRRAISGSPYLVYSEQRIRDLYLYKIDDYLPYEYKNEAFRACRDGAGAWSYRGTPQPGMKSYSTDREFSVARVVSYSEDFDLDYDWVAFGELSDGSVFHMKASCTMSGFECMGSGVILYAPNWNDLIDNLTFSGLSDLISNLKTSDEFMDLLKKEMHNFGKIKVLLSSAFSKKRIMNQPR